MDESLYKAGFVAVLGRPNVGKSTLLNTILGMKVTAVSPWPQTTRKRQMGILTLDDAQIIFVDTPGIHNPLHKLGERMNREAVQVLEECDIALVVVDISQPPTDEDRILFEHVMAGKKSIPVLLVENKLDLLDHNSLDAHHAAFQSLLTNVETIPVSVTRGDNLQELLAWIVAKLPINPPFFPEEQITDLLEREIAADLIRESVLYHLRAEVPHSIAIRIDEYKERASNGVFIAATLFVERESQKGIVIGQRGEMLKNIGVAARQEIESLTGKRVYLQLRVKLRKNWRNDEAALKLFGFGKE
jgi:GTP-binding protein Era